jgi:hypothetical protein
MEEEMSQQTICDGCGRRLCKSPMPGCYELVISGERMNGMGGGGLPEGRFDWCPDCAVAAFSGVRESIRI